MSRRYYPPYWFASASFFRCCRYALTIGLVTPLLTFPLAVSAQAASQTSRRAQLLNATFRLTLLGSETPGQSFGLELVPRGLQVGQTGFDLCGMMNPCIGNGHIYERRFAFPAGTSLEYKFERLTPGGGVQVFASGTETLNQDMTTKAAFRLSANGGNPPPSELPNTGAATGVPLGSLPVSNIALTIAALMFKAGFALRRRALRVKGMTWRL